VQLRVSERLKLPFCCARKDGIHDTGIWGKGGGKMDWAWGFGMMILTGVPAIVGGGLLWHFFHDWQAVIVWEAVLLLIMSFIIVKGGRRNGAHH